MPILACACVRVVILKLWERWADGERREKMPCFEVAHFVVLEDCSKLKLTASIFSYLEIHRKMQKIREERNEAGDASRISNLH